MQADPEIEDRETISVADAYPSRDALTDDDWRRYWAQVEKTLSDVFTGRDYSNEKLDRLKRRVDESRSGTDRSFEAAIYHTDPLQVAADLAEVDELTTSHKTRYVAVLKSFAGSVGGKQAAAICYDRDLLEEVEASTIPRVAPDDVVEPRH